MGITRSSSGRLLGTLGFTIPILYEICATHALNSLNNSSNIYFENLLKRLFPQLNYLNKNNFNIIYKYIVEYLQLEVDLEEFLRIGYFVVKNVLTQQEVIEINKKIMDIYSSQESKYGREKLKQMNELNIVRSLCGYDDEFIHKIY